jgi:hypothetical protein
VALICRQDGYITVETHPELQAVVQALLQDALRYEMLSERHDSSGVLHMHGRAVTQHMHSADYSQHSIYAGDGADNNDASARAARARLSAQWSATALDARLSDRWKLCAPYERAAGCYAEKGIHRGEHDNTGEQLAVATKAGECFGRAAAALAAGRTELYETWRRAAEAVNNVLYLMRHAEPFSNEMVAAEVLVTAAFNLQEFSPATMVGDA